MPFLIDVLPIILVAFAALLIGEDFIHAKRENTDA